ncbi:hypothetical protein HFP05_04850 [Rhodanobacter denitrificans]|nr:hypothetical protein [Rhodanobacter denitrificans]
MPAVFLFSGRRKNLQHLGVHVRKNSPVDKGAEDGPLRHRCIHPMAAAPPLPITVRPVDRSADGMTSAARTGRP